MPESSIEGYPAPKQSEFMMDAIALSETAEKTKLVERFEQDRASGAITDDALQEKRAELQSLPDDRLMADVVDFYESGKNEPALDFYCLLEAVKMRPHLTEIRKS